jgi:hypothetical protein
LSVLERTVETSKKITRPLLSVLEETKDLETKKNYTDIVERFY